MTGERAEEPTHRGGDERSVDPAALELSDDLEARVGELDAIAWNLPRRRDDLLAPPDVAWSPARDAPDAERAA